MSGEERSELLRTSKVGRVEVLYSVNATGLSGLSAPSAKVGWHASFVFFNETGCLAYLPSVAQKGGRRLEECDGDTRTQVEQVTAETLTKRGPAHFLPRVVLYSIHMSGVFVLSGRVLAKSERGRVPQRVETVDALGTGP